MLSKLKSLFEFHPHEQKGILALTIILIAVTGCYYWYDFNYIRPARHNEISPEVYATLMEEHRLNLLLAENSQEAKTHYAAKYESAEDLETRGLSAQDIDVILEQRPYRSEYPSAQYPDEYPRYERKKGLTQLEINQADSAQWVQVKGIGPYTAKKIIQYKSRLGGFTHLSQLREIYKIDPAVFDSSSTTFTCDPTLVQKISINTIDANALAMHPYLTQSQARSLVSYRAMHGNFNSLASLRKSALMDESTVQKIAPYIHFE
jgi:DNA uptake protein ComE-like DNA-binding protein